MTRLLCYLLFLGYTAFTATPADDPKILEYQQDLLLKLKSGLDCTEGQASQDVTASLTHCIDALEKDFSLTNLSRACVSLEYSQACALYTFVLNAHTPDEAIAPTLIPFEEKTRFAVWVALDSYYKGTIPPRFHCIQKSLENCHEHWSADPEATTLSAPAHYFLLFWALARKKMLDILHANTSHSLPLTLNVAGFLKDLQHTPLAIHHFEQRESAPFAQDILQYLINPENIKSVEQFYNLCPLDSVLYQAITAIGQAFTTIGGPKHTITNPTEFVQNIMKAANILGCDSLTWENCSHILEKEPFSLQQKHFKPQTFLHNIFVPTGYEYFINTHFLPLQSKYLLSLATLHDIGASLRYPPAQIREPFYKILQETLEIQNHPVSPDNLGLRFTWTQKIHEIRCVFLHILAKDEQLDAEIARKIVSNCTKEDLHVVEKFCSHKTPVGTRILLSQINLPAASNAPLHSLWFWKKITQQPEEL